jgi:hypothetical protein
VKATNEHFRCDLCGRFSNFGVTESITHDHNLSEQNTVCARCISNATKLLLDGLIKVGELGVAEET